MKKIILVFMFLCLCSAVLFAQTKEDAVAYCDRGLDKVMQSDDEGAIEDFTRAIDIDPEYADAYYNRACAKYDLDDCAGAVEDYTKTIELDPKYKDAYYNRGCAKYDLGDSTGALKDLRKAVKLGYPEANKKIKKIQDEQ
jgi:tetratricopeptide (TPR) repeat protein